MTIAQTVLAAAKAQFEHGEAGELQALLHEAAELRPPTYGKSRKGGALVGKLPTFAAQAMSEFRYTDAVDQGDLRILRFQAKFGDQWLCGVDLVRTDAEGRIVLFEIFARPPKPFWRWARPWARSYSAIQASQPCWAQADRRSRRAPRPTSRLSPLWRPSARQAIRRSAI